MENLKEAKNLLETDFDIEEIFSLESKVEQNIEIVIDIKAIRNGVCHGAFDIIYDHKQHEYIIDFQSILVDINLTKGILGQNY